VRIATSLTWLSVVIGMFCVLAAPRVAQSVPELINYQGELTDSAGSPLNGTVSIVFKIYNLQTGGTTLWQETHNTVQVNEGLFSVLLGSISPFPATLFEGDSRWLGIKVGSDPEMTPRSRIASVAYAIRAQSAEEATTASYAATAGSAPADEDWDVNGTNVYIPSGNVGIGTNSPTAPLHVYKNTGEANATVEADSGNAVLELDGADTYVNFQRYGADRGKVGYQTAGDYLYLYKGGYVVVKDGKLGIGTTSPDSLLHVKMASGNPEAKIETDSGEVDLILDGTSGNQTVTFQQNGSFRGSVGYDTTNGYLFFWEGGKVVVDNGKLGVGTDSPTETLEVNGSVKVTGRCYGTFPRPAYDSGWVSLSASQSKTLTHNVGGNVDNYVVDMSIKDAQDTGINNFYYGIDRSNRLDVVELRGAYYANLTSTQINVGRGISDTTADYVRIRIWTYN
jgi:hypothetical protein